jgi:hypothetical protein
VDVPLRLEVGGVNETVNVTAASPLIDATSTTAGAVISSDLLERVPVGRRISDTLYVAPGVSSGGTVGQANPSMSGGSGLENEYVIDGVNVTNAGYDTWTSLTFGAGPNPNFGQPTSQILGGPQIQTPRQMRVGLRYSF